MKQTVIQIGNSVGIVIPRNLRQKLGLKKGSKVVVEVGPEGRTLLVSRPGKVSSVSSVTPEFVELLKRVNRRYGAALAKLAKLK